MSRRVAAALGLAAAVAALAGCAAPSPAPEPPIVTVSGTLTYRARIALPPQAQAIVELREDPVDTGPVVASRRIALEGRQVPVPFELAVERARLAPGKTYRVRGAFIVGGRPAWVSEPVAIDPTAAAADVGPIVMAPFKPMGFASEWVCGGQAVAVGFIDDLMRIRVAGETVDLRAVPAASGAKYEALGDPATTFWSHGERATLVLRGRALPECRRATP